MDSKLKTTNEVRFDMKDLLPIGIGLTVFAIAIGFGLQITGEMKADFGDSVCASRTDTNKLFNVTNARCYNGTTSKVQIDPNDAAVNGAADSITAVAKFPDKLGILVTVILAAIVIGVLLKFLVFRSE